MKEWWMKFLVFRAVWRTFNRNCMKPGIILYIMSNDPVEELEIWSGNVRGYLLLIFEYSLT